MCILKEKNVSIRKLRHSDLSSYVKEGFGGKEIDEWPVHSFYSYFFKGQKDLAIKKFCVWYKDQLDKYAKIDKHEGGMLKGSLYTLIEKRCDKPYDLCSEFEKKKVIEERVMQRFLLLTSISDNGYLLDKAEKVYAVKKGDLFYLKGGHHRVAALSVLGEEVMPGIIVFPNQLVYNIFTLARKIKKICKNFKIKKNIKNG